MRLLRAVYIYTGVIVTLMLVPVMFLIQLGIDCWRRAK